MSYRKVLYWTALVYVTLIAASIPQFKLNLNEPVAVHILDSSALMSCFRENQMVRDGIAAHPFVSLVKSPKQAQFIIVLTVQSDWDEDTFEMLADSAKYPANKVIFLDFADNFNSHETVFQAPQNAIKVFDKVAGAKHYLDGPVQFGRACSKLRADLHSAKKRRVVFR